MTRYDDPPRKHAPAGRRDPRRPPPADPERNPSPGGRAAPVLIELDEKDASRLPGPDAAPPVETPPVRSDRTGAGTGMERAIRGAARRGTFLGRLFRWAAGGFVGLLISVAAWDFVNSLLARNAVLGQIAAGLLALTLLAALAMTLREWIALARLARVDRLQRSAAAARNAGGRAEAAGVVARLRALYRGRRDLDWALARLVEREGEILDGPALLDFAERTVMQPLDDLARQEVEAAARRVAAVTALVPLALADVATALLANMAMVRRVAQIYGGRAGTFGSWLLMRRVMLHLVATGAVAVGDDLVGSVLGGGVMSKLSRRFGEGTINGALTARVGIAAIELCRPMPFAALPRPGVAETVGRALAGLFSRQSAE